MKVKILSNNCIHPVNPDDKTSIRIPIGGIITVKDEKHLLASGVKFEVVKGGEINPDKPNVKT